MNRYGFLIGLLAAVTVATSACAGTTDVIIHVEDEQGKPVEGALVEAMWVEEPYKPKSRTNAQGTARLVQPDFSDTEIWIKKSGYYATNTRSGDLLYLGDEDPVERTFVLRKKRNPIPLYKKRFKKKIPAKGEKVGVDFAEGDWVAPHGSGDKPHMYVKFTGWAEGFNKFEKRLTITFPRRGDGIQSVEHPPGKNSELRLPYKAPQNGYSPRKVLRTRVTRQESEDWKTSDDIVKVSYENKKDWFGYFLRVNTERNDESKVVKANYAKIVEDIEFQISRTGGGKWPPQGQPDKIDFTYYYNPTPKDRNLEFAEGANLLDEGAQ